jgi:hypothetical protein
MMSRMNRQLDAAVVTVATSPTAAVAEFVGLPRSSRS